MLFSFQRPYLRIARKDLYCVTDLCFCQHKKELFFNKKRNPRLDGFLFFRSGGDLLSHTVSRAVSSAWRVLTSVFGMETGVALALLLPENSLNCKISRSSTAYNWKSIFESGQAVTCPLSRESFYGQASRSISTGKLNVLPRLHRRPINVVVSNGPLGGQAPREILS